MWVLTKNVDSHRIILAVGLRSAVQDFIRDSCVDSDTCNFMLNHFFDTSSCTVYYGGDFDNWTKFCNVMFEN